MLLNNRVIIALLIGLTLSLLAYSEPSPAPIPIPVSSDQTTALQQQAVQLHPLRNNALGLSILYLEDQPQVLTPRIILQKFQQFPWQPSPDSSVTIGNVESTFWLTTTIKSSDLSKDWIIAIDHSGLNLIDTWVFDGNTAILNLEVGSNFPFRLRPFDHPAFHIPVALEANKEYRLLFRVSMSGVLDFPLTMNTSTFTAQYLADSRMKIGIYYGVAIVMVLYNFMIFVYSREVSYLLYVFFIGSLATFLATIEGSAFQYLWPRSPAFNTIAMSLTSAATTFFGTLFTGSFLNIRHHSTRLFYILTAIASISFLSMAGSFVLTTSEAFIFSSLCAMVAFPTILFTGAYMWYQGQIYARYFTIAWALLCVFAVWITLVSLGIMPWAVDSVWNSLRIVSTLEMVLLALALATRIDFLSRNEEKAKAESEAKSQFIAQVSHELRTPMNGVLGMSALLRDHLKDEQAIHFNNVIYQSGLALLGTINDVLDAAKIDADKLEIEYLPFSIKELCEQSLYVIEPQAMVKSLTFFSETDDKIPDTVLGDPNRIRQILLNFLSNAAKFTESGSIGIRSNALRDNVIRIAVTDTGPGIPNHEQQALFQPYSQHLSNPVKASGTGLGLYICSKLTEMMDGKIGVDSIPGEGSCFWIELPLPATDQQPIPLAEQLDETIAPEESGSTLSILVAEDNLTNQLVIEKLLQKMGHSVKIVPNGSDAVITYTEDEDSYDLILMDCEMPVMDGYTACAKIREHERAKQSKPLPIIALTAHALQDYRERCMEAGMNEIITKPVRALSLQQTLRGYSKGILH